MYQIEKFTTFANFKNLCFLADRAVREGKGTNRTTQFAAFTQHLLQN